MNKADDIYWNDDSWEDGGGDAMYALAKELEAENARLTAALEWIESVNAIDDEYQAVARRALGGMK